VGERALLLMLDHPAGVYTVINVKRGLAHNPPQLPREALHLPGR
jgi:hypothetical protein